MPLKWQGIRRHQYRYVHQPLAHSGMALDQKLQWLSVGDLLWHYCKQENRGQVHRCRYYEIEAS